MVKIWITLLKSRNTTLLHERLASAVALRLVHFSIHCLLIFHCPPYYLCPVKSSMNFPLCLLNLYIICGEIDKEFVSLCFPSFFLHQLETVIPGKSYFFGVSTIMKADSFEKMLMLLENCSKGAIFSQLAKKNYMSTCLQSLVTYREFRLQMNHKLYSIMKDLSFILSRSS